MERMLLVPAWEKYTRGTLVDLMTSATINLATELIVWSA